MLDAPCFPLPRVSFVDVSTTNMPALPWSAELLKDNDIATYTSDIDLCHLK